MADIPTDPAVAAVTKVLHDLDCDPNCVEALTIEGRYGRHAKAAVDALTALGWAPLTEIAEQGGATDDAEPDDVRAWEELRSTGLLWLINRVVFHPRGWALALVRRDGQLVGWNLQGDGREVWEFNGDEDALFAAAQNTLTPADIIDDDPHGET